MCLRSYALSRLQSSLFIRVLFAADRVVSCHDESGASLFCVEDFVVAVCGVHHGVCEREVCHEVWSVFRSSDHGAGAVWQKINLWQNILRPQTMELKRL